MKVHLFILLLFLFLLSSCNDSKQNETNTNIPPIEKSVKEKILTDLFHPSSIEKQKFTIENKDTLIKSDSGCSYKIFKNSFQFKDGTSIDSADISIEIQEVLKKSDMILGNLTTQSNNFILESGGMFNIQAYSSGQVLELSKGKEIGITVPTKNIEPGMEIFQGNVTDSSITWNQPAPILNKRIETLERNSYQAEYTYYKYDSPITNEEYQAIWKVIKDKNTEPGDRVMVMDHILQIYNIHKTSIKFRKEDGIFIQDVLSDQGTNFNLRDMNTNYIFSIKNLGWVNIDRIYKDPKAEKVDLIVKVAEHEKFDYVYTTLIFDQREIYIPGYQRKDNSFSFTRNDQDQFVSPIGEEVTIMATSYLEGKPFFTIKKIKIKKEQSIELNLVETTIESIKREIENKI